MNECGEEVPMLTAEYLQSVRAKAKSKEKMDKKSKSFGQCRKVFYSL
jgi:hypothetical protein